MTIEPQDLSTPRSHEQIIQDALGFDEELREEYHRNPAMREAWDDITTEYDDDSPWPDPYSVGRQDDALDIMLGSTEAELAIAWRHIRRAVESGRSLDAAVSVWGIRGHPEFEDWFQVTPPPWGDAAVAQAIINRLSAEERRRENARKKARTKKN